MRIQSKLFILLFVLMTVIFASLAAIRNQERRIIHASFQEGMQEKQESFERVFSGMSNSMRMLAEGYSQWDGMESFLASFAINEKDKSNITYVIETYKMSAVWLYDSHGVLGYCSANNLPVGDFHIPLNSLKTLFQDKPICRFFWKTPAGVVEVYGAAVHPSSDAEIITGYIFLGRLLDKEYVEELSRLIDGRITFLDSHSSATAESDEKLGTFSFIRSLQGWNGITQARMLIQIRNDLIKNFNDSIKLAFFLIVIIAFLAIFVVFTGIFYWIKLPLSAISKSLSAEDDAYIAPLRNTKDEFGEIANMISDFFDQKRDVVELLNTRMSMEKELLLSEQRFRIAAECASDLVYEREPGGGSMEWYGLVDIRLGYAVGEFPRTTQAWEESIHPMDREYVMQLMGKTMKSSKTFFAEYRIRNKDGNYLYWRDHCCMLFDAQGNAQKMIGVITDITDRRKMEDELKSLSLTDPLTGLYNRRGFMTLAEQQIRIANRNHEPMIMLFSDVDGLKKVNDTHGHSAGDELILRASQVMRECFRQSDIIARMGGDEFAVLVVAPQEENDDKLGQRLQDIIDEFNRGAMDKFQLSMSIGFVQYDPCNPCCIEELIAQADRLMYVNKRAKKAAFVKSGLF